MTTIETENNGTFKVVFQHTATSNMEKNPDGKMPKGFIYVQATSRCTILLQEPGLDENGKHIWKEVISVTISKHRHDNFSRPYARGAAFAKALYSDRNLISNELARELADKSKFHYDQRAFNQMRTQVLHLRTTKYC